MLITNFDMQKGSCLTYFGADENGILISLFIKNCIGFDINHNTPFEASVERCTNEAMDYIVSGTDIHIPNNDRWYGIKIIQPRSGHRRKYSTYILHTYDETISFEKPPNYCNKMWIKSIVVPKNKKSLGKKLTLAELPENTRVIAPPTHNPLSQFNYFKRFCLIQDYVKYNSTSLII
jgi:hypothetical protein